MTVAIVDYGSGNLRSAAKAFEHEAAGRRVLVTGKAEDLARADHIVLPGVGAFGDCARGLRRLVGMIEALQENVVRKAKPFLGICVGMQLMAARGPGQARLARGRRDRRRAPRRRAPALRRSGLADAAGGPRRCRPRPVPRGSGVSLRFAVIAP